MLYEILLEIAGPELKCALEVTQPSSDGSNCCTVSVNGV